jgi:hypothetical protein
VPQLVVEIHIPLTPDITVAEDDYPFPWIEVVEDLLAEMEEAGDLEVFDDGEEIDGKYVFFITGRPEQQLLLSASRIATTDGVPEKSYAVVTTDDSEEIGRGRRVDLPV